MSAGGDFIDTANIYVQWVPGGWRGGESESLLGDWMALRRNRNKITIATKVGFNYQDVPQGLLPQTMRTECEKSPKRLGVETIDLYFAHCDDPALRKELVLETFGKLQTEGKIRCLGVSNFATQRLATANLLAAQNNLPRYDVLPHRHTYLQPRLDADTGRQVVLTRDMQDYCAAADVSIMAYYATLGGTYVGESARPLIEGYHSPPNQARLQMSRDVAAECSITTLQAMLAWLWSRPNMLPLIAASSRKQLQENLAACAVKLTRDQLDRLGFAE